MGVGQIVGDVPYHGVGGMAHVASGDDHYRSLAPRPRLGRGVVCARGQGSVEALIALKAMGSVEA